jgi:peroxiredoxin/mono/diheme cytochrome c family protein
MLRSKVALLAGAVLLCIAASVDAADATRIGQRIDGFSLKSSFGKEYALADFADSQAIVVAFLGVECPLARLYAPRLAALAQQYADRKVAFLGIDPNRQDSLEEIAAFARRHKITFPLLRDTGNTVADRFGALRTPEVFVLDRDRVVRYRGRIDNQYGFESGVGYQRPAATRNDLVEAIDEILADKTVSVPATEARGCLIGRALQADPESEVTYSNQIARVFEAHCVECHRAGRIGPFEMTRYEEVAGWGEMIAEVVKEERMPPWHAHPDHGAFANDARLSDEEKQLIYRWVDAGCPEGDPAQLPEPAQFFEGWAIGEPDQSATKIYS